ncbi:M20 family metallopeptidase [Kytococcus sedentarius]|uniref:M20 metallopeptidase family protein n=1 Tax=Kytococcus sedentarius TaxID=1276 RepID=UPI0035BBCD39
MPLTDDANASSTNAGSPGSPGSAALTRDAEALAPELTALRRELHQLPEVGLHLPVTQQRVLDALEGLPLEVTTGTTTTSVVAVLRGEHPGPAVILRADMDALPLVEQNDLPYRSTNEAMHACGHDLHTAALVGAARLLSERREQLHGSVILMFQPGEESLGGAKYMLEEGLLDAARTPHDTVPAGDTPRAGAVPADGGPTEDVPDNEVAAAYALHVFPGERGRIEYAVGPAMASSNRCYVTMHGAGGHGSQPHLATDPVPALLEFGTALQTRITRRFSVFDPVVATITQLSAGDAVNVIPPSANLGATVRTISDEALDGIEAEVTRLANHVAQAHGCTAEVEFVRQYPVTHNHPEATEQAAGWLRELFGEQAVTHHPTPRMTGEDFSFVANQVPGVFLYVGASPDDVDPATAAFNHSPLVLFDDAVLPTMAATLSHLALQRLAG